MDEEQVTVMQLLRKFDRLCVAAIRADDIPTAEEFARRSGLLKMWLEEHIHGRNG